MEQTLFKLPFPLAVISLEFELDKILTADDLLGQKQLKTYTFKTGDKPVQAYNKCEAIIMLLNNTREQEIDIWEREVKVFNYDFAGDLEAWVESYIESVSG